MTITFSQFIAESVEQLLTYRNGFSLRTYKSTHNNHSTEQGSRRYDVDEGECQEDQAYCPTLPSMALLVTDGEG